MFVKRALSAAEEKKAADTLKQDRVHTFRRMIVRAGRIGISGHERPDGDCIGSCLGLWHYLKIHYPQVDCGVYLDDVPDSSGDFQFQLVDVATNEVVKTARNGSGG